MIFVVKQKIFLHESEKTYMKQLKKKLRLALMSVIAIMGMAFLFHTPTAYADGYVNPPEEMVFGEKYTGKIRTTSDIYRYDLTMEKDGKFKLNVTLSNPDEDSNYLIVRLYDEAGERIFDKMINNPFFDISVNLSAGNYYIEADGMMGSYKTTTFTLKPTYQEFPTTSVKKLTNAAGKKLRIAWSKKLTVTGYQVQTAMNSKFTKGRKTYNIAGAGTTSKTIGKLKKSKKYYVRIRTYTTTNDGTNSYSRWSKAKAKKISR